MKPYTGSIQQEDATSQMRPYQGSIRQEASEQEEPKAAVKKPASGALRRVVGDPLVALARGAAKIPNVVSGLGDIVSGGRFGKFLEDEVGYDFEAADRTYNPLLSHETQAAQQKLSEAKGIVDTVSTTVRNPSTIVQAIGESIPSMFVGGAIGRGVVAGASKIPAFAGGAIGEGVTMAGQSADTIRRGNADRRLTAKQAALATGVGVGGGLISGFSGALAKKLGVGNIDEMMVTGKLTNDPLDLLATKKNTVAQVAKGFATEGLLEEAPQSAQETMLQNVAQDKDVMEGVGESVGMGLITGGVMGGAAGGAHNLKRNLGVALADRTARIIKDEKAKQDASAIVTEAKTEVDAAAAAQAQQAKQARDQELAGKLPEIKARVARGVDGQTASFTEDIETVSEVFETTSDPKAKLEAGTLLNKLEKSADEAATDEEKATVKNNVTDIGHLQNAIVSDPYDVEAEEALFAYVNDSDPITAKKASDAITKGNEQKEKLEAEAVKKQDEQEKKTRADQEALGQAHRDELRADNKATEAVKLSEEKISDFKQKIREAATTTQKNSLRIKMNTEEQNLKHLKAERDLEKGKTLSAKEALRPERSVITDMMGGQQIYEAVVNHKSFHKIAATAKNYLDYAKQMIAAFGKKIEAHLKDLWAYAKTTLRSERGSISFEEQEQHAANLAEDHWTDESAPQQEDYEQPESMSFDNDLENESMSFDNDLDEEGLIFKKDLPIDKEYETPDGQKSRIGTTVKKENQQARNDLSAKDGKSDREHLTVGDKIKVDADLNALSDSHYTGEIAEGNKRDEYGDDVESINIMDFLAPYEDTYKEAGQKMHARSDAPVKDVEGKMLARLSRKDVVTNKEYKSELLALRKQGLTAKHVSVLTDAVDTLVKENDLTRAAFDQMKKELLSPVSTINHNIESGDVKSAAGALLMIQDEIDARFDEEFELKGTDYGDQVDLKSDLLRPEYSTVEQTVSYFMRKDAPNSDTNWAKAGPGSPAWIDQAKKREKKLKEKNFTLIAALGTALSKNKKLDMYAKTVHSDYSVLGKHSKDMTDSEWHDELSELDTTLIEMAEMGFSMEPIVKELFASYGTFDKVTSLPNEEASRLLEKLMNIIKATPETVDDTISENDLIESTLKRAEASKEKRYELPYGPQLPKPTPTTVDERYAAYKGQIKAASKASTMIDLFYDAIDAMQSNTQDMGAIVYSPDVMASEMMRLDKEGRTRSEYRDAAVEIGKATRLITDDTTTVTDEEAEVNPSLVREQLTLINNENPGDLPEIEPHDKPTEMPVSFATLNEMYPRELYDVVNPDGTSFVTTADELKAMKLSAKFEGVATQISRKDLSSYNDLYQYNLPNTNPKSQNKTWPVMVSGDMIRLGKIPFVKINDKPVFAVPASKSRNINNELVLNGKPRSEALYATDRLDDAMAIQSALVDPSPTATHLLWSDAIADLYAQARVLLDENNAATIADADKATKLKVDALYKRVNKGKALLKELLHKGRREATKKIFTQQHIMDEKKFGRDAIGINTQLKGISDKQFSPADMFSLYEASDYSLDGYLAAVNKVVVAAINDSVSAAYLKLGANQVDSHSVMAEANDWGTPEMLGNSILVSRLSTAEREMYEAMINKKTVEHSDIRKEDEDNGKEWSGSRVKTSQPIENTFDKMTRAKLEAIRDIEQRMAQHYKSSSYTTGLINDFRESANSANKNDKRKAKNNPLKHDAHVKELNNIMASKEAAAVATIADHVVVVPENKRTADESSIVERYPGSELKVVKSRNTLMQHFFDMVARMFDADLILVSGDNAFSGRYIPKGLDGRSKIVANVNAGSIARVFAHELFHHAINKLDPKAYEAFRYAIKEVVHEDKWNDAVLKLGRQLEGAEVTKELRAILTNEFNSNPHATAVLSIKKHHPDFPVGKKPVGAETRESVTLNVEAKELAENELYAEIFAQAIHQRGFWEALGKHSFEGRGLAAKLVMRIAANSAKMMKVITRLSRSHMNNNMVAAVVKDWTGVGYASTVDGAKERVVGANMNEILIDVLDKAYMSNYLRDGVERANTTVLNEIKTKSEALYASGEAKLNKAYTTTFPNQSKGYKDVMTAIEKWLDSVVQWIAKHKPAGLFADFYLEEDIRALGNQIIHAGERQRQEAYNRVVLKHKEAFKGMDDTKLAALHQAIIRNPNKNERDRYWNKLTPEQKAAFEAMETVVAELNAGLVSRGLVAADHAFVEYGQAIRLLHKDNVVDDSIDAVIKDAHSQIAGNPSFTKQNNSKMTLAQLETKYGMTPQTLNPMHMFMNYVSGVSAMIGFHDTIKEGMAKGFVRHTALAGMVVVDDKAFSLVNKHGGAKFKIMVGDKPFLINEKPAVFDTEEKATAAIEAYQAQIQDQHDEQFGEQPSLFDDESQKGTVSEMEEDDRSYMDIAHYTVTTERNFAAIGEPAAWEFVSKETFSSKEDAEAHAQKQSGSDTKIVVSPVFQKAQIESNTKLYFTPDFAKLINVILSKDDLRKGQFLGLSGEKVMKVKNGMTALEMSFSAFHAFTIGQEMMASNAAWHKGRTGDWSLKAFNPRQGKKDAFEISALMNKVITDNDYAKTTEGKAEMKRLLGSDSIDAVDIYHQFFGNGGLFHMDDSLKTGMENWGEMNYEGFGGFIDDMHATLEKQRLAHPNSPIAAFSKTLLHTTMRGSSAWLMEHGIPKIKFATFCREYSLKVDQETTKQGRPLTANEKSLLARNTMYFIEDRFGEVNWKNMWLNKSYKTALQFAFRSFTWVAGSWVALTKAGVDIAKLGWFTLKGEKYTLTERGYWGIAALAAHSMTAFSVYAVYAASAAAGGEEEEETDVATPLLTRLLFPRIDPYDNTKRIGIPSYVTESYKIFSHLGLTGNSFEPEKLITGRFNSLVGNTIDLVKGEDFRGVSIINPDDSLLEKSYSVAKHMMVSPISFSNIAKGIQTEGFQSKGLLLSTLGFSDAPAFAKRSHATNVAFELSRREYKGKEVTEEEMDIKDNLKKALYAYSRGDKSSVDELLAEGKVSQRQYDIAITRYPVINNMPNPKYKDPLAQALSRLTVKSALKVYEAMSEEEKEKHASEITKKMNNMRIRKDTPKELQEKYFSKWEELRA